MGKEFNNLSDCIAEIKVVGLAKPYYAFDPNHVKEFIKVFLEDCEKEKDAIINSINMQKLKEILYKRAGGELT